MVYIIVPCCRGRIMLSVSMSHIALLVVEGGDKSTKDARGR